MEEINNFELMKRKMIDKARMQLGRAIFAPFGLQDCEVLFMMQIYTSLSMLLYL